MIMPKVPLTILKVGQLGIDIPKYSSSAKFQAVYIGKKYLAIEAVTVSNALDWFYQNKSHNLWKLLGYISLLDSDT